MPDTLWTSSSANDRLNSDVRVLLYDVSMDDMIDEYVSCQSMCEIVMENDGASLS